MSASDKGANRPDRRGGWLRGVEAMEERNLLSVSPLGGASSLVETAIDDSLSPQSALTDTADSWSVDLGTIHETYGLTGAGQTVVVIDSGVAYDHVALGGGYGDGYRVVGGYDFAENDGDPYDDGPRGSHGTHVTGILASDDPYHIGVAPDVDIVSLRVLDDDGNGDFTQVEAALQWVLDNLDSFENPITTINMSLGTRTTQEAVAGEAILEEELAALEAEGIFISVAAGNQFQSTLTTGLSYPAVSPYVVPVGSVDADGSLSYFSQRAESIIAAPGRSIQSSIPDYRGDQNGIADDYGRYSGTSMAAPYVSGASVLLREAYDTIGVLDVDQDLLYNLMVTTADTIYDPVTGQEYCRLNLLNAIETVFADYDPTEVVPPSDPGNVVVEPAAPIDLGVITQTTIGAISVAADGTRFSMTASQDGLLSIEVPASSHVNFELVDAEDRPVEIVFQEDGRVDVLVEAGQTIQLKLTTEDGAAASLDSLRLTNLVKLDGTTLWVTGTENDDTFAFSSEGTGSILVNGVAYQVDSSAIDRIIFHAGNGHDSAELTGTDGNDQVQLRADAAQAVFGSIRIDTIGVESHTIDGRGGADSLVLYGTTKNDSLFLSPNATRFSGEGFDHQLTGFTKVQAQGGGGQDQVTFTDSAGNDTLVVTTEYAKLSGAGFYLRAEGFGQIEARSTGGQDIAYLRDSAGDDTFVASPTEASLIGDGYQVQVDGFRYVYAYATQGGVNTARLFDSASKDTFIAGPEYAKLYGTGFYLRTNGFSQVDAYSSGGADVAHLYDSAGNDTFSGTAEVASMVGNRFSNRVHQFRYVAAYAYESGSDSAYVYGTDSDETLLLRSDQMRLYSTDTDYRITQFDRYFASTGGGNDVAYLFADGKENRLLASDTAIQLVNDIVADLYGINQVYASATGTGQHDAEVSAVDLLLQLIGSWRY